MSYQTPQGPPPPIEEWPWYQAEHIRRQSEALESIRASCIGILWILGIMLLLFLIGVATS